MKNVAKIIAVLLVLLVILSGCFSRNGSSTNTTNLNPANPVTVTLWHYYVSENQQALETAVSLFNRTIGIEYGVVVEAVAMGSISELEAEVKNSAKGVINSLPMPQLFSSYPDNAFQIDALDMLVDLNEYFTEEEKQLYVTDFLEDGIFGEGRMLVLPIVKSTELLYLNNTAWQAFAANEGYKESSLATWDDVLRTARAYYLWSQSEIGEEWAESSLMGIDSVANYIIIGCKQQGLDVIDAGADGGGRANLDDEEALRKVFENYYLGYSLGFYSAVGKFRSDDIKSGDLISYVGSSSSAAYFPTWIEKEGAQLDIDFKALPYPYFKGGQQYAVQQGAGMCMAKSTPAQQEGAAMFLKWFTAAEQNIDFAMNSGYLPVQNDAYTSQEFADTIETLKNGSEAQKNVSEVYEVALEQITNSSTYAAQPFAGSYEIRYILQNTLMDAASAGRARADAMKKEGANEEEIFEALEIELNFDKWISELKSELDKAEIPY